jgi:hypothetical protein
VSEDEAGDLHALRAGGPTTRTGTGTGTRARALLAGGGAWSEAAAAGVGRLVAEQPTMGCEGSGAGGTL